MSEHRLTPPLPKQEDAMILLFLFVWREKGTFPFANSQQRQFFSSENQGFNTFTDLGLKFSVYFLNGGGGCCFLFVKRGLLFVRNGQDRSWRVPGAHDLQQWTPSKESNPIHPLASLAGHPASLGEHPSLGKIKFMQALSHHHAKKQKKWLGLGKFTQTLFWVRCSSNKRYFHIF